LEQNLLDESVSAEPPDHSLKSGPQEVIPPSPNDLNSIKNNWIGAVDKTASADVVPCTINVSG